MPRPTQTQTIEILTNRPEWQNVLAYNQLYARIEARKETPWHYVGPWDDVQDTKLVSWLEDNKVLVSRDIAIRAAQVVAQENSFDPLAESLKSIKWDGKERSAEWLSTYLGAVNTPYTRAVGQKWLISAVARVFEPGCKVDSCMILEGPQGMGKSTALSIIGGEFYTDEIAEFGSKDAALQMQRAWIIELAELDSLTKPEMSRIKAFMSRSSDSFRPPYSRYVIDSPRHCVFAGTVNHSQYLRDETGNRRFWPVECVQLDKDALVRDRSQLLAEAYRLYLLGESWWLEDSEVITAAREEQEKHFDTDVWHDSIASFLCGFEETSINQILEHCIQKPLERQTQRDKATVGRCLRVLGWVPARQRRDGGLKYVYRAPENWSTEKTIGGLTIKSFSDTMLVEK